MALAGVLDREVEEQHTPSYAYLTAMVA